MKNLIKKIQNTAFEHSLFQKKSKIIIGVSGGPDSVCLLDILAKLKKKYALDLYIAHVNYGLRRKDSDNDQKFVEKLAQRYSLPLEIERPVIRNFSNLESQLREIRYEFFEKIRKKHAFDLVAVAHNLDDQVETFFLHLIRGAGLTGLSAMKFKNNLIIRPLLGISRREIIKYLKQNSIKYRTDKTNKESILTRNKVRNKLIPQIEARFNSNIKKTIFDTTIAIAEDQSFLENIVEQYIKERPELRVKELLSLHPAIFRRVLLAKIGKTKKNLKEIEHSHIKEIEKILKSTKGKSQIIQLKGLKIIRKGDKVNMEMLD